MRIKLFMYYLRPG